jgi:hypothetical protein
MAKAGWASADVVAKMASTRVVTLAGGEYAVSFARSALEDIAEQIRTRFIPITVEHFSLLPPVGRWYAAEVVAAPDGAYELLAHGRYLRHLHPAGTDPDPQAMIAQAGQAEGASVSVEIEAVVFEPRNFESVIAQELIATAPVRVEVENRWSVLPPLEWILSITVTWGLIRFVGSFLDTLGRETAESLVAWIRTSSDRSKEPRRDRIVTLRFRLPDETLVYGFVPVSATAAESEVLPALDAAGIIAEFAGARAVGGQLDTIRQAAFVWSGTEWRLAWWVVSDDTVRVTNWFLANEPDPSRFLGRPLLEGRSRAYG